MTSVLHICTDFWPSTGGIERFVLDLATRSQAVGVRAGVLCLDRVKSHPGRLPSRATVSGLAVTRVPCIDLKFYRPAVLPLALLKKHDILHVHGAGAQLDFAVATKWLHRRPIVLSTHGGLFHTRTLLPVKSAYFFGLQPLVMRYVDVVAACSKSDARLFGRISRHVVLMENAVDVDPYLALSRDEEQRGRCVCVGRLADNKGVPELLHAFAFAKNLGARFQLHLVGRDHDGRAARYRRLVEELELVGQVVFRGELSQDELLHEYQQAQLFVSASRHEGFGLSAVEAKAAGCRLVLNRNAAFTDIFSSDPAATLVDFADSAAAGNALADALSRADAMSAAQRREVQMYSWRHRLHEWRTLYGRCVASAQASLA